VILANFVNCDNLISADDIESKVIFTIYEHPKSSGSIWAAGVSLSSYGCNISGKFAMFAHGWNDLSLWVDIFVQNLFKYRGGCIIRIDYSASANSDDYFLTLKQFDPISAVITKRLIDMENDGISADNMYLYGFSFGARLVIDACINFGPRKIKSIDVCEPANIGFDKKYTKDPKDAAQNVQCMFTSSYAGSSIRDQCHQNWLMGNCGQSVPGTKDLPYIFCSLNSKCKDEYLGSHTMCNNLFNSAFENDFHASDIKKCTGTTDLKGVPSNFKMGYNELRKNVCGVFSAPTVEYYPYTV